MIEKIDTSREAVRRTGKALLIGPGAIALLLLVKAMLSGEQGPWDIGYGLSTEPWKWFLGSGLLFFVLSRVAYPVMKPLHIGWMVFAQVLGWFNTRLVLGLVFYLVLTPMSFVMRILRKDLLNERLHPEEESYWIRREPKTQDPKDLERPF